MVLDGTLRSLGRGSNPFLQLLQQQLPQRPRVMVVAGSQSEAEQIVQRLQEAIIGGNYSVSNGGFTEFVLRREEVDAAVQRLPDTPEGRQMRRLYARTEGKHWDAEGLVRGLEVSIDPKHPVIAAARPLFLRHLQVYLDLLWDVAQHTHEGPADVVRMVMFALAADELLVAFHTAQRGYAEPSVRAPERSFHKKDK